MTKNFIEDNQFREKDNAARIIEIMNSFDGVTGTTVFYDVDVDYRPALHWRVLRVALIGGLVAGLASWLARRRG